jgi:hypothetical protein
MLRLLTVLFLFCVFHYSSAQQININVNNLPLNKVMYELMDRYNIQVSFNDKLLSKYAITLHQDFSSVSSALEKLLEHTQLDYQLQGEIIIIVKKKMQKFYVMASIVDRKSREALPFAHVMYKSNQVISDQNGTFSFTSKDSIFPVQIQYLGYYILDTILTSGNHQILLRSSLFGLSEVSVEGKTIAKTMESGEEAGKIRLNHKVARKIPGNGDNAIFNFLRLQPGILAAGEQSGDLIIWGAYEGQSKVVFDGFTLFGLKNFNDNISAINPYMAKDIILSKGAFGAEYGNRVGGIIDITGVTGSKEKPSMQLNVNNMTMSGLTSVPLNERNAFTLAFRRTYYNLYDSENIFPQRAEEAKNEINVYPDYTFGDFNLKLAGTNTKIGNYYISLYSGNDEFTYDLQQDRNFVTINQSANENNKQIGGSFYLNTSIRPGVQNEIIIAHSQLNTTIAQDQLVKQIATGNIVRERESSSGNLVTESSITNKLKLVSGTDRKNALQIGIGYAANRINLHSHDWETDLINSTSESGRIETYISDQIILADMMNIKAGIRMDIPLLIQRPFIQPRLSMKLKPSEHLNLYAAWGKYNQFISKTSMLDDNNNYQFFWALTDESEVPVVYSTHYVSGLSMKNSYLNFTCEAFVKQASGLTRYVNKIREQEFNVYEGNSISRGIDFLLKGRLKKHEAWVAYSLSESLEYFPYFHTDNYRYAPHDQRHEVKTTILLDLSPFNLSVNYVFGTGFPGDPKDLEERVPYKRCDASIIYNFSLEGYKFEAGLSILNLFNNENIKHANFIKVPTDQLTSINIHAEAVPFTPTLFLNLVF